HLTGEMHAITAAHDLLAAMIDNHIYHHGALVDRDSVTWRRVIDVSDRVLRNIIVGLGAHEDGVIRQTGFDITAASEVMTVLALTTSLQDMRKRLGRIVIGNTTDGKPITAEELHAAGAMTVVLRDAIKPNLLQTLENTPVLVHAGPSGNIATGNSSVIADLMGIHCGDFLVTEAGFAADMGAERFFNIRCRASGLSPDAAVIVATVRALKVHSGRFKVVAGKPLPPEMLTESPDDVWAGAPNLRKQVENIKLHGVTPVIAINAFPGDHDSEHAAVRAIADELGVRSAVCHNFSEGGKGAVELAEAVVEAANEPSSFHFLYPDDMSLRDKIETIATKVYGAGRIEYEKGDLVGLSRIVPAPAGYECCDEDAVHRRQNRGGRRRARRHRRRPRASVLSGLCRAHTACLDGVGDPARGCGPRARGPASRRGAAGRPPKVRALPPRHRRARPAGAGPRDRAPGSSPMGPVPHRPRHDQGELPVGPRWQRDRDLYRVAGGRDHGLRD